jgi:hypothetical protein
MARMFVTIAVGYIAYIAIYRDYLQYTVILVNFNLTIAGPGLCRGRNNSN